MPRQRKTDPRPPAFYDSDNVPGREYHVRHCTVPGQDQYVFFALEPFGCFYRKRPWHCEEPYAFLACATLFLKQYAGAPRPQRCPYRNLCEGCLAWLVKEDRVFTDAVVAFDYSYCSAVCLKKPVDTPWLDHYGCHNPGGLE